MKNIWTAVRLLLFFTLITGIGYPYLMLALGGALFPEQAAGSLLHRDGAVVGSALVAQKFSDPKYFWPRPSAADYATVPSGASNQSPTSKALQTAVAERQAAWVQAGAKVGREMLFASGSGLDPEISPASALGQIPRILKARGLDGTPDQAIKLEALVEKLTQKRDLGFLGQERVNVLRLNLALDALSAPVALSKE